MCGVGFEHTDLLVSLGFMSIITELCENSETNISKYGQIDRIGGL